MSLISGICSLTHEIRGRDCESQPPPQNCTDHLRAITISAVSHYAQHFLRIMCIAHNQIKIVFCFFLCNQFSLIQDWMEKYKC